MKTALTNIIVSLLISCTFLLASTEAYAASILQSKNGKVLLSLDGDNVSVGQNIGFKNSSGKTVAVATITQVRGSRAIAEIKKGQLSGGETVFYGKSAAKAPPPPAEESIMADANDDGTVASTKEAYRLNSTKIAGVVTMGMNNMITKQADGSPTPNTEDVTLKGSSIGFAGTLDLPVNSWLILRGTLGYEPFTAAGTSRFVSCNNLTSTDCNANINYLSGGGFARVNLTNSAFQIWGGLGGTMKFPVSKTSTALKTDDIKMTFTFAGALGADWFISNKYFIPISAEYQMFQSSDTVSANIILVRAGFGIAL